ncbi:hypothetical protein [Parasedimentitalea psychrophila]|uniref:DUF2497 domain-containing protein n=1 Tax=Parasedimentitalea psychrophila TaxID=2997337 RepID=A0A9Y2KVP2_9RHOB|nr:hypothetical protein [Parasedimentitalea psychrophila]WIY23533.1 hypothetical protein QPJ95_12780 [Parasedimentitalea psychrophila]
MSEPVTHAEIEDVLSSIRRLVSEDGRETVVPGRPAATTGKPVARLVLTPCLRVADDLVDAAANDTQAVDTQTVETQAVETQAVEAQTEPQLSDLASKIETAIFESGLAEPSDDKPEGQPSAGSETDHLVDETHEYAVAESHSVDPEDHCDDTFLHAVAPIAVNPQAGDAPWHDPGATLFAAAGGADSIADSAVEVETPDEAKPVTSFAEKIAALEAAIGQGDEQWEPDGEPGEANAATAVETLAWEDLEDELVEVAPLGVAEADDCADSDPQRDITPEIAPEIAPEKVSESAAEIIPEIAPEFTPETAPESVAAFDPPSFDRPEFDQPGIDQPGAEPLEAIHLAEQAVADEVLDALAADEAVMDEESLRELVADIVREELQGALGERITRNVRKLVRREIHRALAVQDLG